MLAFVVARITIRVMLHCKPAKGCLELNLGAASAYAQNLVVIALGHPASALEPMAPGQAYVIRLPKAPAKIHPRTSARG